MDTGYLAFAENATVAEAMAELRKSEEVIEDLHTIFLVDRSTASATAFRWRNCFSPRATPRSKNSLRIPCYTFSRRKSRIASRKCSTSTISLPCRLWTIRQRSSG